MSKTTVRHLIEGPIPQDGEEPQHENFVYKKKDIESSGAIRGCVCKACKEKRAKS